MSEVAETQRESWNYGQLYCALIFAVILQSFILPCACYIGTINFILALAFDGLIVLRIIIAKLAKQNDRGWIFYAILTYLSPFWIRLATYLLSGKH